MFNYTMPRYAVFACSKRQKKDLRLIGFMLCIGLTSFPNLANWELKETNVNARHESTLVVANESLYLLGGRGVKPIEFFHAKSQQWQDAVAQTSLELHHFQAVEWQKNIYIIGAFTGRYPNETGVENVLIFNTDSHQLTSSTAFPQNRIRGSVSAGVYNGKIYLAGGITHGHQSGSVAWFDEYDPETKRFTALTDAPISRDHAAIAVVNDKLYHIGGRRTSAQTGQVFELTIPEVDVYDFNTQSWQTLPALTNIPTPRAGANVVVKGHEIWVIGGESGKHKLAHAEVEVLNTLTHTWRIAPSLNVGRHSGGAALYNEEIIVVSGSGKRGGRPELTSIEVLTDF
jgi:N-acetylneuraminic acid mutarotase